MTPAIEAFDAWADAQLERLRGKVGRRKGYYPAERGREDALVLARYIPHDEDWEV